MATPATVTMTVRTWLLSLSILPIEFIVLEKKEERARKNGEHVTRDDVDDILIHSEVLACMQHLFLTMWCYYTHSHPYVDPRAS